MTALRSSRAAREDDADVVVVGAGHAGIEAALAAARMGARVRLLTLSLDGIGQMSCNPAIGGIGKGHLVAEIDALGGEMGRAIDECGIQFRRLNTRKGPAVQALRAQADKDRYRRRMRRVVEATESIELQQGQATGLLVERGVVVGVETEDGGRVRARSVVVTTGTFLNGLLHYGCEQIAGGRAGDRAAVGLTAALVDLGLTVGRLKTGTCPRLDGRTIRYDSLEEQPGDDDAQCFSTDGTLRERLPQRSCWITYTNSTTHRVIRESIDKSPIYNGAIHSRGPRYCPSIEDKVMKFPDRDEHRIFLEPEGLDTDEVYPNGLSTSLPIEVQREFVATVPGLERAEIVRPGYAIEYDYVDPTQLEASLAVRDVPGLYLAGQINGTTGYEEAGAQGLVAGINAARSALGDEPLLLGRSQAYIGVMIDDLVTRGVDGEPYRMFTSRAEHRLLLRCDNAGERLTPVGRGMGLIDDARWRAFEQRRTALTGALDGLAETRLTPNAAVVATFARLGVAAPTGAATALEVLGRAGIDYATVAELAGLPRYSSSVERSCEIAATYSSYIRRQEEEVRASRDLEATRLPPSLRYAAVDGLSSEAVEKLDRVRPASLAQAARVSGVTPAAVSAIAIHLRKTGAA